MQQASRIMGGERAIAEGGAERNAAVGERAPLSRRLLIFLPFAAIASAACQRKEPNRRRFTGYGAWEPDGGGE